MSEGQNNGPVRMTLDKAKDLYDEGNVTVLDVVDSETFEKVDYKIEGGRTHQSGRHQRRIYTTT